MEKNRLRQTFLSVGGAWSLAFLSISTSNVTYGVNQPTIPRRVEIVHLLSLQPGQVSATEAGALVASLKADASKAISEIETLTTSTNVVERLLGFFLILEVQGGSETTMDRAATDDSAHVRAEVAEWLFLKGQFEQWDSFLSTVVASLSASETELLYALLDNRPVRLEIPAAMSILGLGRGLPNLVVEVLRRDDSAVAVARRQLQASGTPSVRKENLLSLLHQANSTGYVGVLEEIILASEDDGPLRWQAIWQYSQSASGDGPTKFLSALLDQRPQDGLAEKVKEALTAVSNRTAEARMPVSKLESRLKREERPQYYIQDSAVGKLIPYYIQIAKQEPSFTPDSELLRFIQRTYPTNTTGDYQFRRTRADIDYLIWRVEKK